MNKPTKSLLALLLPLCFCFASCTTRPVAGGYTKAETSEQNVLKAAKFALFVQTKRSAYDHIPLKLELLKVLRAEQQVVAGTNYKLTLSITENGVPKTVEVVVWDQPWRKPFRYQLTSWK